MYVCMCVCACVCVCVCVLGMIFNWSFSIGPALNHQSFKIYKFFKNKRLPHMRQIF